MSKEKNKEYTYPKGCLTDSEWDELVALEYVLTWRFSEDEETDEKRYKELSNKRWESLDI